MTTNGFLILFLDDDEAIQGYHDGSIRIDSIDNAFVYQDKAAARLMAGRLQQMDTSFEIRVQPAKKTVVLESVPQLVIPQTPEAVTPATSATTAVTTAPVAVTPAAPAIATS